MAEAKIDILRHADELGRLSAICEAITRLVTICAPGEVAVYPQALGVLRQRADLLQRDLGITRQPLSEPVAEPGSAYEGLSGPPATEKP